MKTFLLSLLLLFPLPLHFISLNSALPRTTPTTLRSSSDIYNLDLPEVNNCVPNTSGKTFQVVAPIQMNAELDGNFQLSYGQFLSTNIYCDTINTGSCGVTADVGEGAEILPFEVLGIADDKSKAKAADIVTVQSEINFNKSQPFGFMGPYSSGIAKGLVEGATGPLVTVNKLGIFPGSSSPSIFANNNVSYGMLIPSTQFLDVVFDVYGNGTNNNNEFDGLGLKNVSYVYDTKILTSGICNTIRDGQDGSPGRATSNNMKYVESWPLSESEFSNETKMDEITQQIKDSAVELVVFCTYESGCEAMVDMFHRNKYYPKASSFIICAGLKSFEDYAGSKLMDMTGVALWTPDVPGVDNFTGWTPREFNDEYARQNGAPPTYQAMAAAGSLSIWAQAIQATGSVDSEILSTYIGNSSHQPFETVYGLVSFDEHGQNNGGAFLTQYQIVDPSSISEPTRRILQATNPSTTPLSVKPKITYPPSKNSVLLNYPAPTFPQRKCQTNSFTTAGGLCASTGGTCLPSGKCSCPTSLQTVTDPGSGEQLCVPLPNTTYDYIGITLRAVGYAIMAIIMLCCFLLLLWIIIFRRDRIIRASQPLFMIIVLVGVFIYAAAIFPLTADDEWTDISDGNQWWCMTTIWLGAMGFVLIFGALFAKAWRINKIFQNKSMKRVVIKPRDVLWPIVVLGTVMVGVMLVFTFAPECPYQWETTVTLNGFGQILDSSGRCAAQQYSTGMDGAVAAVQLVALGLCCWQFYCCRNVSVDYSESKWISYAVLSTLQVIAIALPFQFMGLNPDATFLVLLLKYTIICIAILLFVFVPKIYYWKREKWPLKPKAMTDRERTMAAANSRVSNGGGRNFRGAGGAFSGPFGAGGNASMARGSQGSRNSTKSSHEAYGAKARLTLHTSNPNNKIHLGGATSSEARSSTRESAGNIVVGEDFEEWDDSDIEIIRVSFSDDPK